MTVFAPPEVAVHMSSSPETSPTRASALPEALVLSSPEISPTCASAHSGVSVV